MSQLESGIFVETASGPTFKLMYKVWKEIKAFMHYDGKSVITSLWENSRLEEVQNLEGIHCWYTHIHAGTLILFDMQLKCTHNKL